MGEGAIAAGWYPDPADPARLRRWDGQKWTADIVLAQDNTPAVPPPYQPSQYQQPGQSAPLFGSPAPPTAEGSSSAEPPRVPEPARAPEPPRAADPPSPPPPAAAPQEPTPTAGAEDLPDWANQPGITLPPDLSSIDGDPRVLRQPLFEDPPPAAPKFDPPVFEPPSFEAPRFEQPRFDPPKFDAPKFAAPQFAPPLFATPPPPAQAAPTAPPPAAAPAEATPPPAVEAPAAPVVPAPPAPPQVAHAAAAPSQPAEPYAPPPSGALYSAPVPPGVQQYTPPPPGMALPASALPPAVPSFGPGQSRIIPNSHNPNAGVSGSLALPRAQEDVSSQSAVTSSQAPLRTGTLGVWMIAVVPVLQFAVVYALFDSLKLPLIPGIQWAILLLPALLTLLFAAADRGRLRDRGHPQTANAALGVFAPVYLVARTVILGMRAVAPLVVWLVLQAAAVAAVVHFLPALVSATIPNS